MHCIKFSIITVCYNAENVIRKTMESALNQTWKNFEYIIVDGDSTDATVEIVKAYAKRDSRIQWYSGKDTGIYNAMNKGIHYAEGDFIYFLNAGDVLYSKDVLGEVAEEIAGSQADVVIGDIVVGDETGIKRYYQAVGEQLLYNLRNRINVCHQAIFASKDSLKEGFDEQFIICADYDWLCRQVNRGRCISKVNTIIVVYDTKGISHQGCYQKISIKEVTRVIRKNFLETDMWNYSKIEKLLIDERRNRYLYDYMNRWLALKQNGVDIITFFLTNEIWRVAIYGFHHLGQRLYNELCDSQVKVLYVIDKNKSQKVNYGIKIISPDEVKNMEPVDAIIITPVFDYLEIKENMIRQVNSEMIPIDEILFYKYTEE